LKEFGIFFFVCFGYKALWPGILYVGASRAEAERNVAIAFEVTKQGMSKVCSYEGWIKQNNAVLRLVSCATADRQARYNDPAGFRGGDSTEHWGSKFDFASRLDWFIVAMPHQHKVQRPQPQWDE
jgi:hypothetical protein